MYWNSRTATERVMALWALTGKRTGVMTGASDNVVMTAAGLLSCHWRSLTLQFQSLQSSAKLRRC